MGNMDGRDSCGQGKRADWLSRRASSENCGIASGVFSAVPSDVSASPKTRHTTTAAAQQSKEETLEFYMGHDDSVFDRFLTRNRRCTRLCRYWRPRDF